MVENLSSSITKSDLAEELGVLERLTREWSEPWVTARENRKKLEALGIGAAVELGRAPLPTDFGGWTYIGYGDLTTGLHHALLVYGNVDDGSIGDGEDLLVRIHSSCRTNEIFSAINCECRPELLTAMQLIQKDGAGIIVYLEQEGRGTGVVGKLAQLRGMFEWQADGSIDQRRDLLTGARIDTDLAYRQAGYPSECRDFTIAGEMLHALGVRSVRLLTNNPAKIRGVTESGISVVPVEIHIQPTNPIVAADLESKAKNLGHSISPEHYRFDG